MSKIIWPVITVAIVAIVAAVLSNWTDLGYMPSVLIIIAAVLVNGIVATVEDDIPGGFNNPDGTDTPKYIAYLMWSGRLLFWAFLGICVFAISLWAFG